MALRFPRFSQDLAQDPTTRRIWFGIATAVSCIIFFFFFDLSLVSLTFSFF